MRGSRKSEFIPDGPAGDLARGVMRLFGDLGQSCLAELPLGNGRRVDVMALGRGGQLTVVEIKTTAADYRSDRKWRDYLPYCDAFYFAVPETFDRSLLPDGVGIIVADGWGGAILTASPEYKLAPARRKAVTLRFARAAGRRLMRLDGPDY
ncbi:MAG: MmcB family DNA repair protein [Alphaproteobacteria bacterium]|nr:MmcB family DNA repair protein [Alphaproteobacteria bacterium]